MLEQLFAQLIVRTLKQANLTKYRNDFKIIDSTTVGLCLQKDDLSGQGDAAMDYSVLLWPLRHDSSWPIWREKVLDGAGTAVVERLELFFRAKLLDNVIDVLADFVEAEQVPEHREEAQRKAKAVHLHSYPQYLAKYASDKAPAPRCHLLVGAQRKYFIFLSNNWGNQFDLSDWFTN
ncbi:hypothetical protein [Paenibacillus hexagrammi]|uniref:Uncharacterized protein n=1 Tax=Paenibacillus hexagrammi TaxID=2908839 RepID=A0ABY3SNW9_9BACL|nr:hypothetical protein [Paenibacillus sp. YPD9-1]UJF35522.1 hypothetical protein L0M14_10705 [Paenibacillus sp. YPD9-1]